jgi:hypothetical protein
MKGFVYFNTAYRLGYSQVPECFKKLDDFFDELLFKNGKVWVRESSDLAQNLCRRMADIKLYAWLTSQAETAPDAFKGAILIGTYLVGYFSACKSLLDAGSITLAKLYNLNLSNKEMDFSKQKFWKELQEKQPTVYHRYTTFDGLVKDILKWRDSAVHRVTLLVIVHAPDDPDKTPRDKQEIRMVAKPDAELSAVAKMFEKTVWVEPVHFHNNWKSRLMKFCEEVCLDIRDKTQSSLLQSSQPQDS